MCNLITRFKHVNFYLFEIFIFFRFVSQSISMIAISLLIQDKICLNEYGQKPEYCQNIQLETDDSSEIDVRNRILAQTTTFNLYKNLFECIPMFIWSLFVGSFLDRHPTGTRFLLFFNVIGSILTYVIFMINVQIMNSSVYYILIGSLPVILTGGITALLVVVFHYITVNTAEKDRSYKFVVLEIIFVIGFSGAGYFSGQILELNSIKNFVKDNPEYFRIRTYNNNFYLSIGLDIFSLFILYLLIKTEKSRLEEKLQLQKIIEAEIETLINEDDDNGNMFEATNNDQALLKTNIQPSYGALESLPLNDASFQDEETVEELISKGKIRRLFGMLFDFDNLKQTLICFTKSRPDRVRLQIYLLYIALFLQLLTTQGMQSVFLQFSERVYQWDSERFSTLNALSQIISMILLAFGTVIFLKCLKWDDEILIIVSLISTLLRHLLMGTYLSEKAFFSSLLVGFMAGFTVVAIRAKISKIVPEQEVGKIFSLSSSMESLVPLFGSLIFSNLFSLTIYSYPGFIYQFAAILILLSLAITVVEEIFCPIKSYLDLVTSHRHRGLSVSTARDNSQQHHIQRINRNDHNSMHEITIVHCNPQQQQQQQRQTTSRSHR